MENSPDGSLEFQDLVQDRNAHLLADRGLEDSLLRDAISKLCPRYALVVRLYFLEENTLEEAGKIIGVTRERVRQILNQAVNQLRKIMKSPLPPQPRKGRRFSRVRNDQIRHGVLPVAPSTSR